MADLDTELMWSLYLDTVAELDAAAEKKTGRRSARYDDVLTRAVDAGRLPYEHCLNMVSRLESANDVPRAASVIDSVVARSTRPEQVTVLLKEKLQLLCRHKTDLGTVSVEFFAALDVLAKYKRTSSTWDKDTTGLCRIVSGYAKSLTGKECAKDVQAFFKKCLGLEPKLGVEFKADFLLWAAKANGKLLFLDANSSHSFVVIVSSFYF